MPKVRDASPAGNISAYPSPLELCKWCREFDKIPFQDLRNNSQDFPHFLSFQDIERGAKTCQICIRILIALQEDEGLDWSDLCSDWLTGVRDYTIYTRSCESDLPFTLKVGARTERVDLFVVFEWKNTVYRIYYGAMTIEPQREESPSEVARRAQRSRFTGSEEHFSMIRDWLYSCSGEHATCTTREQKPERPTRLLEIIDNGRFVRVVTKEQSSLVPYATLSYCWGPNPDLQKMLLKNNQESYGKGVSVTSLHNVFQDAISVCQGMSVRYLWVDALCIVQGTGGDFKEEAPRMRDVYAGSTFTIVAASSSDPTHRFLVERDPRLWYSYRLSQGWIDNAKDFCSKSKNTPSNMIVDTRGWCYQERCLSSRSIYFTNEGVHWECREGIACEDYVQTGDHSRHRIPESDFTVPVKVVYRDVLFFKLDWDNKSMLADVEVLWWKVLPSYLKTKLSHHEDRLIAIAGIASLFMKKFDMSAICGLWEDLFIHGLLWHVCEGENLPSRQGECLVPSWSWASMPSCHIERCHTKISEKNEDIGWAALVDLTWVLIKSSSATCMSLPPLDSFGLLDRRDAVAVSSRKPVRIMGRLLLFQMGEFNKMTGGYNFIRGGSERGASVRKYFPDTIQKEANLCCVLLRTEQRKNPWAIIKEFDMNDHTRCLQRFGLVLAPMQDEEGVYRRTGTFEELVYARKGEDDSPSSLWDDDGEKQEADFPSSPSYDLQEELEADLPSSPLYDLQEELEADFPSSPWDDLQEEQEVIII